MAAATNRGASAAPLRRASSPICWFSLARLTAQRRHGELIDNDGLSCCGAYWGNGFHEDGVNSALAVCQVLNGVTSPACVGSL